MSQCGWLQINFKSNVAAEMWIKKESKEEKKRSKWNEK